MEHVTRQEDDSASLLYHVKRPVYNVGYIEGNLLHRRKRTTKTFSQRLAAQLRCSSARARSIVFSFVPILTWLPSYPVKEYLFGDVVSGLSTGVMQLPQGLAYAMLAAVPPVYGLYTSFYPVLLYTFFGTSRHVSIGTFAVVSLMIGGVVIREAPDSMFYTQALNGTNASAVLDTEARDSRRVQLAVALSCQVGIIQLILGLLQFGFVAIYLTEPLVRGFTTAASVHVCVSQLKYFLGIKTMRFSGPLSVLHSLVAVLTNISSTNVNTLIIGTVCILFLFTVKKINDRFKGKLPVPIPGEIIVVIVSTGISYGIQLSDNYEVAVVGKIPTGLLPPAVPDFSVFSCLITDSITIAVVSFAVGISLAKTFALKHGYSVDGNQELIALGVCNFLSSFFHTFTVTSSMSRSLVQESTGGKTQIAGLLASLVVLLVVVAIGFFFQPLPQTVLASIIIVNLQGMFLQFGDICALWKMSGIELGIWLVSFIASVLLGLDYGLMVAIGFAVLTVIYRTQSPKRMILGEIPDTGIYCDIEDYEEATECTGIKIFHSNAPIYFANSDLYINSLKEKTGVNPALLLATQKSHRTKKKRGKEEKAARYKAESQKREAVVKLDVETGVTHEVVGGVEFHLVPLKNGQAAEGLVEYDSEETQFDSESETHNFLGHRPPSAVHSIILDFTPVNFIDSVGAKAIKSVIKEYAEVDIQIFLAGCSSTLLADLRSLQFFVGAVTPELAFPSIHDAVLHCLHRSRTGRDAAVSVA